MSADRKGGLSFSERLAALKAPPLPEDRHANEHVFPNLPTDGARIGRFTAQHFADGIFSEVFRAYDPDALPEKRLVALKVTTPDLMTPPHDSAREARILTAAKNANITPLLETFQQAGGHLVLVFPYMPQDLNQLLRTEKLPVHARQQVLRDLFAGLAHLHSLGIIHRDIKPSNILMASPKGPAYLADFGTAWSPTDAASEPAGEKVLDVGTTCYRPPELLFGNTSYGSKLDMWAAGCVAAQVVCLGGETLFDAGELGSELALINSLFQTLGTPDLGVWPEAEAFHDWGKMNFTKYPAKPWEGILPGCDGEARELVRGLVVYESGDRLSAAEALEHPYFR